MKLDIFDFVYNKGLPGEWRVEECRLSQTNLIVGKNASGKSRILRAIHTLSELLSESGSLAPQPKSYEWRLLFDIDTPEQKTEYILKIEKGLVIKEKLIIGSKSDEPLLDRDESGEGTIFANDKEINKHIRFQTDQKELAVVKRRDSIQHPFLEDLYQWSSSLRFYEFGTQLGKNTMARIPSTMELLKNKTDFKDSNSVVGIFVIGKQERGDEFTKAILSDMREIGYKLSKIDTKVPSLINPDISAVDSPDNLPRFLYIQEEDLTSVTEQSEMSQGMFRALSLFIQINYSLLADKPSCIIIDDIGEGLDYQRSSSIIKILIEKAKTKTGLVQLIMTTNDEFIMNGVPIEYWSVIERTPGSAKLHNISNSRDKIEEFKFIGLNNFDLFTSEFLLPKEGEEEA